METAGKRVADGSRNDEGPTIMEMEDPDAEGSSAQKHAHDEPEAQVGMESGGSKKAASVPEITPRKACSATYDGMGVRGGLSLASVTDDDVLRYLQERNTSVPVDIIRSLLDAGVQSHCGGVGLRKALEEKIDRLALEWSTTVEKILDVFWLSLRRAYCVFEAGGDNARPLRIALGSIIKDGKDQRTLEHFLAQVGSLLNEWSDTKPRCSGCVDKDKWADYYGFDPRIVGSHIFCVKGGNVLPVKVGEFVPMKWAKQNLPEKVDKNGFVYVGQKRLTKKVERFEQSEAVLKVDDKDWKKLLECSEGDVVLVDSGVDVEATVDLVVVSLIWRSQGQEKLTKAISGIVPKKCLQPLFPCSCGLWNTDWKLWTDIVSSSIRDVKASLPSQKQLLGRLANDSSTLSEPAKRLYNFIKYDLDHDGGCLRTGLSSTFLAANVPELQVGLNNLLDTEQGGGDLKAWSRVFSSLAAVERSGLGEKDSVICQVLGRKALKAIVCDVLSPFIVSGAFSSQFGFLWQPPIQRNGAGLERCPSGWKTAESDASPAVVVPKNKYELAKLGDLISQGVIPFAPYPFLRVRDIPESCAALSALKCRLVLISCAPADAAFEQSLGGTLTRLLLSQVLKRFRSAIIVVASSEWCQWWKEKLSAITSAGGGAKAQRVGRLSSFQLALL
jgi:hypothetical protein